MQGIIATPNGDVWALGLSKNQLLYFPKGDWNKGKIVCEGRKVEPCKSLLGPFHLGIDQQDRIGVTNAMGAHVTRFPASDPTKAEKFKTGYSGSGLGIDSQGNVWVTNRFGNSDRGMFDIVENIAVLKAGGNSDERLAREMAKQHGGRDGGSLTLLRPDGTQYPARPSRVAACPDRGRRPSTVTTTSGSRTSRCPTVPSRSCVERAPRIVRRV